MDTRNLDVFVQAAAAGSLSKAARRLGLTPMIASRRLAALENELDVRLMHRTTRSVALPPEGETFLPHALATLEAEEAGRASIAPGKERASGLLRVTASAAFGRKIVTPLMPAFLAANPDLKVHLQLTDSIVDIVADGIDLAVRIGRLPDSSLIARKLAANPRVLCAAPSFLARVGRPASVPDLARFDCIVLDGNEIWKFEAAGQVAQIRASGRLATNSIEAVHEACVAGLGLAILSLWDVFDELKSGALVALELDVLSPQEFGIWAVYPSAQHVPLKLRAFIAALERALKANLGKHV